MTAHQLPEWTSPYINALIAKNIKALKKALSKKCFGEDIFFMIDFLSGNYFSEETE